jgi:hypothetical protein
MAVLTVDVGGSPISYVCRRGGHAAPRKAGNRGYAFAGDETSGVRAEFMVPVVLSNLTGDEVVTLRTLFENGAQVPCSGDVFNNGGATVVCSATMTDELSESTSWWIVSLTLYEVGGLGYVPDEIILYLTNVAAGGGIFVASTDVADDPFGAGTGTIDIMDAPEVIPTCGDPLSPDPSLHCTVGYSATAEAVWESIPAPADGWLTGSPYLRVLSGGGTGDAWNTQSVMAKLYIDRGGSDVAQWDTEYSEGNGGFAGSYITAQTAAVVFQVLAGDIMRVEIYGRAGLNGGYSAGTDWQHLSHGNNGGGAHHATVRYRGTALFE